MWRCRRENAATTTIRHLLGSQSVIKSTRRLTAAVSLSPLFLAMYAASASAATVVDVHGHDTKVLNSTYVSATAGIGAASTANDRHAELLGLENDSALQQL